MHRACRSVSVSNWRRAAAGSSRTDWRKQRQQCRMQPSTLLPGCNQTHRLQHTAPSSVPPSSSLCEEQNAVVSRDLSPPSPSPAFPPAAAAARADGEEELLLLSAASAAPPPALHHYMLTCEYVGPAFHGWMGGNPQYPCVLSVLTAAVQKSTGLRPIKIVGAGRTDAGVHALAQVCSFALPASDPSEPSSPPLFSCSRLLFLINQSLYHAHRQHHVHVVSLRRVTEQFHPRYSALRRVYLYRLVLGCPLLFERNRAWHIPHMLDLRSMREAAALLLGTHDFASLASASSRSPLRTVNSIDIEAFPAQSPFASPAASASSSSPSSSPSLPPSAVFSSSFSSTVVHITVTAPSFLHHQIRNTVAALVEVGRGLLSAADISRLLQGRRRRCNPLGCAPAHGLWMKEVQYDAELMQGWTMEQADDGSTAATARDAADTGEDEQDEQQERQREEGRQDSRLLLSDSEDRKRESRGRGGAVYEWRANANGAADDYLWQKLQRQPQRGEQ